MIPDKAHHLFTPFRLNLLCLHPDELVVVAIPNLSFTLQSNGLLTGRGLAVDRNVVIEGAAVDKNCR